MESTMQPSGDLGLTIIRGNAKARIDAELAKWRPGSDLGKVVARAIPHLPHELALELLDRVQSVLVVESRLSLKIVRGHGLWLAGLIAKGDRIVEDRGIVGHKVITTVGVNFLAACFDNTNEFEAMKYHGIGTGTGAEATGDTALGTELTTEYQTDNTRPAGTNSHSTNTFSSVATNTLDSGTPAITEQGLFDNASRGSGNLFDRTKFAAINLVGANGDALQSTYTGTLTAGG